MTARAELRVGERSRHVQPEQLGSAYQRGWTAAYVAALLAVFLPLYLLTRSPILIGDGELFVDLARDADPTQLHYAEPSHFLQVPLAHGMWRGLGTLGLPVPLETIFLGLSLTGMLTAIIFVGLIAAEISRAKAAAWLAAVLFGTSLVGWTQWNGELYGLGLGFVTAGLFFTLRGRLWVAAILWALAVLSHSEFALAAPAFLLAVWMVQPGTAKTGATLRTALWLFVSAATAVVVALLIGSWSLGKWSDIASLGGWLWRSYEARQRDVSGPEVVRAIKGLVTAYTVAGHYWRDILTGRGQLSRPDFLLGSAVGFLLLLATGVFICAAAWRRQGLLFALAWLLPSHVLVNWWIFPTAEKYHAPALPGFILLVTGGLVHLAGRMPRRSRSLLYAGYAVACAALNLFGAVLPMRAIGNDIIEAAHEIRTLNEERGGRVVFVACDNRRALAGTDIKFLRVRSIWAGTVAEVQDTVLSWTMARVREGEEPYLLDRWCLPEEWNTRWSKERFDLFFLERYFHLVPTRITRVPLDQGAFTNPFSWMRSDIVRIEPRERSQ